MRYVSLLVLMFLAGAVAVGSVSYSEIAAWACEPTSPEVSTELLFAIASVESSLLPEAVNRTSGARGLFQFVEVTVCDVSNRLGYPFDPLKPDQATKAAKIYLSWLMRVFGEDNLVYVLAGWHWGPTNMMKMLRGEIEAIPFSTLCFINKVNCVLKVRRSLYEEESDSLKTE